MEDHLRRQGQEVLSRAITTIALAVWLVSGTPLAIADEEPTPGDGEIVIPVDDPGSPGSPGDPGTPGAPGDGDTGETTPPPPDLCAGDPGGPGCAVGTAGGDPGPGQPAAPPDPGTLAQRALDTLQLATADIRMAPQPPDMTYVGLETWLWVPQAQWTPLGKSVTAGATTVHVDAHPVRVVWDLTEGSLNCDDAGRVWADGMDSDEQTSCGYTFSSTSADQPAGAYEVAATIVYQVGWTCVGNCTSAGGTLGEVNGVTGESAIRVGERQSVVVS